MTRPGTTWWRSAVAATLLCAWAPLGAAAAAPDADTPTCHGRPATLVGTRGGTVTGTPGDDVIVSAGATTIHAGTGDDTICVTTPAGDDDGVTLTTSDGGDYVNARTAGVAIGATLVGGGTTYLGSRSFDTVTIHRPSVDAAPDVVRTGGGDDDVYAEDGGARDPDTITTGPGADGITFDAVPGGGSLSLGPGRGDYLALGGSTTGSGPTAAVSATAWRVDAATDTLSAAGASEPLTGLRTLFVDRTLEWTHLAFVGSDAAEDVEFAGRASLDGRGPIAVHLGGGNDRVYVEAGLTGHVDGGPGRDLFGVSPHRGRTHVDADLRTGRVASAGRTVRESSFALDYLGDLTSARVRGTAGPDDVTVDACSSVVDGGAGDDVLTAQLPGTFEDLDRTRCSGHGGVVARLDGGPGADRLLGTTGRDVLVGGPGRDRVDGRGGHDVCRAERVRGCHG